MGKWRFSQTQNTYRCSFGNSCWNRLFIAIFWSSKCANLGSGTRTRILSKSKLRTKHQRNQSTSSKWRDYPRDRGYSHQSSQKVSSYCSQNPHTIGDFFSKKDKNLSLYLGFCFCAESNGFRFAFGRGKGIVSQIYFF